MDGVVDIRYNLKCPLEREMIEMTTISQPASQPVRFRMIFVYLNTEDDDDAMVSLPHDRHLLKLLSIYSTPSSAAAPVQNPQT